MSRVTRRGAIGVIAGGALGLVGGVGLVSAQSETDLFRSVLEHYLGPVAISDEDMNAFVVHFQTRRGALIPGARLSDAWAALRRSGLHDAARSVLPDGPATVIDRFERWVLAEFHTVTDVALRSDPADSVTFLGTSACLNPFAQFEAA